MLRKRSVLMRSPPTTQFYLLLLRYQRGVGRREAGHRHQTSASARASTSLRPPTAFNLEQRGRTWRSQSSEIGAAGYIAPRHRRADQKETGGRLVAALDRRPSSVIDSYFPDARFFRSSSGSTAISKARPRPGKGVKFVSICSPNYLHTRMRVALRIDADAICEKPSLVLNPWNIDGLASGSALGAACSLEAPRNPRVSARSKDHRRHGTYITSRLLAAGHVVEG